MAEQAQVALNFCLNHPGEEIGLYCKICKKPTCPECFKTDHVGHDFDTISQLYRKINNRRSDLIRDLETQVAWKGSHNREHLCEVKRGNNKSLTTNLENVEKKRTEMHKTVDALIDVHVQSLNSKGARLCEGISKNEDVFERDESAVLKMLETFKKTTMKGLDLIEYYEELKSKVHALPTVDVSQCSNTQVFVANEMDRSVVQRLIGEIRETKHRTYSVQQVSSFQCSKNMVHTICPISSDEAWITYDSEKKFTLLRSDGNRIKKVTKDAKRHSFILQNESFLLCNEDKNNILKIDMAGKKALWMDVSPLITRFIGHALNGNILITLVDEPVTTRTTQSQRQVQMVTSLGHILHTYGHKRAGTMLTLPTRVMQNYNSDVCLVNLFLDAKGSERGNICVFFEDGEMKYIYGGHDNTFHPSSLCCDSLCNIICTDCYNNTIHIVNSAGFFVQYLFSRETCIPDAFSLALHNETLWIGSDGGEIRVYHYK